MKKENVSQVTLKNQEVNLMEVKNIPVNKKVLPKWSAMRVEYCKYNKRSKEDKQPFKLIQTNLVELVKTPEYAQFKDRFNWLYNNYSADNYKLVWSELQDHNENLKQQCFIKDALDRAEGWMWWQIQDVEAHFGEIPAWVKRLDENQRQLLLDRARTCYGLVPEYDICTVISRQLYDVPERYIKDATVYENSYIEKSDTPVKVFGTGKAQRTIKYNNVHHIDGKESNPIDYYYNIIHSTETVMQYYNTEELHKAGITPSHYQTLVGKVKVTVEHLKRLAEDAVLRDARWMSQYNGTEYDLREHREVEDTSDYEERIQQAIEFIEKHRDEYAPDELLQTVLYLYNINPTEFNKNSMVPITDLQGADTPYGVDVQFRDFLEPIYAEDEGR